MIPKSVRRVAPLLLFCLSLEGRFSFSRKSERALDLSQTAALAVRRSCDGYTAPEDHPLVKAAFSGSAGDRSFTISTFQKQTCKLDVKGKCLETQKEGWRDVWTVRSTGASKTDRISLRACYAWGTAEHSQYVLSAWYTDVPDRKKIPWKQTPVKRVSTNPEVYEFSDPLGGGGRLELIAE